MYNRIFAILALLTICLGLAGGPGNGARAAAGTSPAQVASTPPQPGLGGDPERSFFIHPRPGDFSAGFQPSPLSPQVTLGPSGLSYRYIQTIGVTGEPYQTDADHLNLPFGVFVDGSNNLYVVEYNGQRLLKYNSAGFNQLIIGRPGQPGYQEDHLVYPKDVAVRNDGHIWVVISHALKEYDADGNYVQSFPLDDPWESGDDNGHFNDPTSLAFDPAGLLYVSDSGNHRIQIFTLATGTPVYVATIGLGVPTDSNLGFDYPAMIAFDNLGRLYVADKNNHRIQRCTFTTSWNCATYFGVTGVPGNDLSHLDNPFGVTVRNNDVYIADSENYRILKCNLSGVCQHFAGVTDAPGSDNSHFSWVADVAVDASSYVYVSDFGNHRVQKFNSAGVYQYTFGITQVPYVADTERINTPWGVASALDGSLYVTENFGYRLLKYDAGGSQTWAVGQAGVVGADNYHFGDFWAALEGGLAVDAGGRVYVTDTGNQRVMVYNADGSFFTQLGETRVGGDDNAHFNCPAGAAINPSNGDLFINDKCNHRVQVFYSNLTYKTTIGVTGVSGDDNLHFFDPRDVAVDAAGNIYVADHGNFRVQKCNLVGLGYTCSTFAGETGNFSFSFDHLAPLGVGVDSHGRVFVADDWNNRVQVFSSSGAYLTTIGGYGGNNNGSFNGPADVAVDRRGRVYVADRGNHRVQVFAPGYMGWVQSNLNGFGNPFNNWITDMVEFQDQLYAGVAYSDWDGYYTSSLWKTADGKTWTEVNQSGMNLVMGSIQSMEEFGGMLYTGTYTDTGGLVYRSPDGVNWTPVSAPGMGVLGNAEVHQLKAFNGYLYAGMLNFSAGGQIWRTPNGLDWTNVITDNFTTGNTAWWGFEEHGGKLYAGFAVGDYPDSHGALIRTGDGESWEAVTLDGFGDSGNLAIHGLASYQGYLYVSTRNFSGAQVWRSQSGDPGTWQKVVNDGFGDPANSRAFNLLAGEDLLFLVITNLATGDQVWATHNGVDWFPLTQDGWGDPNTIFSGYADKAALVFEDLVYIGTSNNGANGAKVWTYYLRHPVYLPLMQR